MNKVTVYDCSIIEITKVANRSGNISIIAGHKNLPFIPKRIFYLYDIPAGEARGAHAHKECHQFIIAASGAFEISLNDGINCKTVSLNRPFFGLHIPPGIWAHELNFSSGAICLVLASHLYQPDDYIREYTVFLDWKKENGIKNF